MQASDIAIVGAGVMGLAHAYHAARAGMTVTVFERDPFANGATTRNFGMLALIAQAEGVTMESALRNLGCWQEVSAHANISLLHSGCLLLAKHAQEMDVLTEFSRLKRAGVSSEKILTPEKLQSYTSVSYTHLTLPTIYSV